VSRLRSPFATRALANDVLARGIGDMVGMARALLADPDLPKKWQAGAEDRVVPMMDRPVRIDRDALILGYAGVYSSFLLFAKRASTKYGVPSADILVELGRQKTVGGQEDMIEDLAINMARAKGGGR